MTKTPHRTQSKRQNWRTPRWLVAAVEAILGKAFALDAAADADNTLCISFHDGVTPETDGLVQPWISNTWCNPPFDRTAEFLLKAIEEAKRGVYSCLLLTASTENAYWTPALESGVLGSIVFITGRVPFIDPDTGMPVSNNVTGSVLFFFGPSAPKTQTHWIRRDELKVLGLERLSRSA